MQAASPKATSGDPSWQERTERTMTCHRSAIASACAHVHTLNMWDLLWPYLLSYWTPAKLLRPEQNQFHGNKAHIGTPSILISFDNFDLRFRKAQIQGLTTQAVDNIGTYPHIGNEASRKGRGNTKGASLLTHRDRMGQRQYVGLSIRKNQIEQIVRICQFAAWFDKLS